MGRQKISPAAGFPQHSSPTIPVSVPDEAYIKSAETEAIRFRDRSVQVFKPSSSLVPTRAFLNFNLSLYYTRHKKPPKKLTGPGKAYHAPTIEEYFRTEYFQILDTSIKQLSDRIINWLCSFEAVSRARKDFIVRQNKYRCTSLSWAPLCIPKMLKVGGTSVNFLARSARQLYIPRTYEFVTPPLLL